VIEAWSTSGETVAAFARRVGLGAGRIYWWRERMGGVQTTAGVVEARAVPAPGPAFLPVVVRAAPASSGATSAPITVCMQGGLRVEVAGLDGMSAAWVATLVRSLAEVRS
jgi:hypothetical protein